MSQIRRNEAFRQIVNDYSGRVYAQAHAILGDRREAEEATQDVFLNVYRGLKRYRRESDLATWIYRIVMNVCLSRKRKAERPISSLEEAKHASAIISDAGNPELLYLEEETKRLLASCISKLSGREIQALTLFYYDGLRYDEISGVMNLPVGSVATILHRARARLHVHVLMQRKEKEK
jgi:RNA polymerase sigma-70 factor (ECF subfamily)